MADAVTSQTLSDGDRTAVVKFTNISDGSGEASVKKVDVSALATSSRDGATCTRVHITQVWYAISGMRIDLEWDASTNVKGLILGAGIALEPTMDILILDLLVELKIMLVVVLLVILI